MAVARGRRPVRSASVAAMCRARHGRAWPKGMSRHVAGRGQACSDVSSVGMYLRVRMPVGATPAASQPISRAPLQRTSVLALCGVGAAVSTHASSLVGSMASHLYCTGISVDICANIRSRILTTPLEITPSVRELMPDVRSQ
jgi:hypothetical protein